jgi:integrase
MTTLPTREQRAAPLTLREAYTRHYLTQRPGITDTTKRQAIYRINCWERAVGASDDISAITREDFNKLRTIMLASDFAAASIESTVSVVRTIIEACVEDGILPGCPSVGKRLKVRPQNRWTPELKDLSAIYRFVHRTTWPVRRIPPGGWTGTACAENGGFVRSFSADHWWRTLFAAGYFLGLRHGDLLDLRWTDIKTDRVVRTMAKTRYVVEIPLHDVLREHLRRMPQDGPLVFGPRAKANKQIRRELRFMVEAAKIGHFTLKGLRKLSARSWETARPGAGCCILGHRLRGAQAHYLDAFRILSDALTALAVPEAMKEQAAASDPFTIVVSTDWGM